MYADIYEHCLKRAVQVVYKDLNDEYIRSGDDGHKSNLVSAALNWYHACSSRVSDKDRFKSTVLIFCMRCLSIKEELVLHEHSLLATEGGEKFWYEPAEDNNCAFSELTCDLLEEALNSLFLEMASMHVESSLFRCFFRFVHPLIGNGHFQVFDATSRYKPGTLVRVPYSQLDSEVTNELIIPEDYKQQFPNSTVLCITLEDADYPQAADQHGIHLFEVMRDEQFPFEKSVLFRI